MRLSGPLAAALALLAAGAPPARAQRTGPDPFRTLRLPIDSAALGARGDSLLAGFRRLAGTFEARGAGPEPRGPLAGGPAAGTPPPSRRSPADTTRRPAAPFENYADLAIQFNARIEAKTERNKNERCASSQLFAVGSGCRGSFQPNFDFQFDIKTGGVVADRIHVDVDYDSKREFDASNNINVYYQGKPDEIVHRLEVGNVSFAPPPSRFITAGIPSGNYGLQAIGQVGPMRFQSIFATQKGNVVRGRTFTIGDRALRQNALEVEDYQVEPRRFFFTIDPRLLGGWPNVDILDAQRMLALASALPDTLRPTRIYLYRYLFGGQPPNQTGPQFEVRGARGGANRGPIYELLREGIDYYVDQSQLWFALVRPLNLTNERLVVAYRVRIGGIDTTYVPTGGTPDLELTARRQFANLVWDPQVTPRDSAFFREIRSVYRVGGEDLRRQTVNVRVVAGSSGDQEKPVGGTADTYLQMFGLAQPTSPSTFDVENRLWPRPTDPNYNVSAGGAGAKIIRDHFLVLPSLRPFARNGLVQPGNPANDTLYVTPNEDLYSTRHPETLYRIRVRYESEGGGDAGSLMLGASQLRQNSERILVDGLQLVRGTDYIVDYDLGQVSFLRPDTLFARARQVSVQFEENPQFGEQPTSIFGLTTRFPSVNGELSFTAISQSQRTLYTRPPLGFEPSGSMVAGVSGAYTWNASLLSAALAKLPFTRAPGPSRIDFQGEFATSRPRPNAAGQAYVESFEGEGGVPVFLDDPAWYFSSVPSPGPALSARIGAGTLVPERAATLAWQSNGIGPDGSRLTFTLAEIDSLTSFTGSGYLAPERLLWLTLYPLSVGGAPRDTTYLWKVGDSPAGRRWRSIREVLNAAGADLSRVETLEFWALADTSLAGRTANPTLVFDFGDISEASVAIEPETLTVRPGVANPARPDSAYSGKRVAGLDRLDTERDPFTRTFNAATNDLGLPGDRLESITVVENGVPRTEPRVFLCSRGDQSIARIGDTRTNCTVGNNRLDEEDLDADLVLNPSDDSYRRYIVDLADRAQWERVGRCNVSQADTLDGVPRQRDLCWVHVRLPFRAPAESLGTPNVRRTRALRLTMVSGAGEHDDAFTRTALAALRLVGAPWVRRTESVITGIGGETNETLNGYVIASLIGTNDAIYQSPPGVIEAPETQTGGIQAARIQINEKSLRLLAGDLRPLQRAEAYFRFPEGQKNLMAYRQLRVWARGRGNGWGQSGELEFYVKVGRDANNFYLYRTKVNSGTTQAAWLPEVRVDFRRFQALRTRVQNAFLQNKADSLACTGTDSLLVVRSFKPVERSTGPRFAACDGNGYMMYTIDPSVSPPNLATVQELAVGMVRVDSAGLAADRITPGDTLELWVDDIRLADVEDTPGYAGQIGLAVRAGDIADIRINAVRRDPHFRQLAEQPTFLEQGSVDVGSSIRLDRLLPEGFGWAIPVAVTYSSSGTDPLFLSQTDIRGDAIAGLRTPMTRAASYAASLRRTTPLRSAWLGPLVNNLALNGTYASADTRSEYQKGRARNYTLGADYTLAPPGRAVRIPGLLDRALGALPATLRESEAVRGLRNSAWRLTPLQLRLTSTLARSADRRASFLKPASALDDTATVVEGVDHVWRNGSVLELRPLGGLSARWDLSSVRDLRQYGDTNPVVRAASRERSQFLGVGGIERERLMQTAVNITPLVTAWLRPRLDWGTSYSITRDPNARTLLEYESDTADRLPRRLAASQTFLAGTTVDLARAMRGYTRDSSLVRRLTGAVLPVDVTFNRSLLSAFDQTPIDPDAAYQFGIGGVRDFRKVRGRDATSAGVTTQLQVNNGLLLPLGLSLANRFQRTSTRNWTRRFAITPESTTHAVVDGAQTVFPDLSLRWQYRPRRLTAVFSSLGGTARMLRTRQTQFAPPIAGGPADESESDSRSLPLSATIAWALFGGFTTSAGLTETTRRDDRPGGLIDSRTVDASADLGKSFTLPAQWGFGEPSAGSGTGAGQELRTRLTFQRVQTRSHALDPARNGSAGRLADNGRHIVNFNADTDLAENLTGSLVFGRTVTFDEMNDRRFTQTVISAILQIRFFSGELR